MRMTKYLKAGAAGFANWLPDMLMFGGAAGISYGASLIYLPAGFVVGGILAVVGGVVLARGAK